MVEKISDKLPHEALEESEKALDTLRAQYEAMKVTLMAVTAQRDTYQGQRLYAEAERTRSRTALAAITERMKASDAEARLGERDVLRKELSAAMRRAHELSLDLAEAPVALRKATKDMQETGRRAERLQATIEVIQLSRNSAQVERDKAVEEAHRLRGDNGILQAENKALKEQVSNLLRPLSLRMKDEISKNVAARIERTEAEGRAALKPPPPAEAKI